MSPVSFISRYLGLTNSSVGHVERLISGLGGFCGIAGVYVISAWWLDETAAMLIMGFGSVSALMAALSVSIHVL